ARRAARTARAHRSRLEGRDERPMKGKGKRQAAARKAKGERQKAKGGEGSESDSVSPFSRPASDALSPRESKRRAPSKIGHSSAKQTPSSRASSKRVTTAGARSVVVLGAGRLGTALARALAACGYEVRALVSRGEAGARRAVETAGVKAQALTFARLEELPPSEILFITTPDDALAGVAERVAALPGGQARGRAALHTSGALSSEV